MKRLYQDMWGTAARLRLRTAQQVPEQNLASVNVWGILKKKDDKNEQTM